MLSASRVRMPVRAGRGGVADGERPDAALLAGCHALAERRFRLGPEHDGAVGSGELIQEELLHLAHGQNTR